MIRALCLSASLLCPVWAAAEPVTVSGSIAAGTTDLGKGADLAAVDLTVRVPLTSRLTAEIGTYLYALDGKRPHETYAALALDDQWRLGAVRPAYDAVLPSVFARMAPYLAYQRAEYSRAHATTEAMRNTAVPWGLSWQGRLGETDVALSLHDAVKGSFRTVSAAISHARPGWTFAAAIEPVWHRDGSYLGLNAKAGVQAEWTSGSAALALLHPEANDRPDALSFEMAARMQDRLDLHAFGEFTRSGEDDAFGAGLSHALSKTGSLQVAVTDGAEGRALHLSFEHRF